MTGKLMLGRVYGTTVLVFDDDNDDFETIDEEYEETTNFGIDVSPSIGCRISSSRPSCVTSMPPNSTG